MELARSVMADGGVWWFSAAPMRAPSSLLGLSPSFGLGSRVPFGLAVVLALPLASIACGSTTSTDGPASSVSPTTTPESSADGGTANGEPPGTDTPINSNGDGPKIPKATGTCPAIVSGEVTFAPAGVPPRKVTMAVDAAAASTPGPLLFYWHATGSQPAEARYSLGASESAFKKSGGVIVAPSADPEAGQFEWFIVNKSPKLDDFLVADEIVACLVAAKRVDPTRIHSMGMSAGGLQTTAFSFLRSSYVASVATYSGGLPDGFDPQPEDTTNKFAAFIFDGGDSDSVYGVDFKSASERYQSTLNAAGHFTALCDHGKGHSIPRDAAPSVVAFFAANPYGAWPSPYASAGLPKTFPAYCK